MKWKEFSAFIAGLDSESPLGRIVSIRAETDTERLKQFTLEMRRIRSKWRARKAKTVPEKEVDAFLASMQDTFKRLAGAQEQNAVESR